MTRWRRGGRCWRAAVAVAAAAALAGACTSSRPPPQRDLGRERPPATAPPPPAATAVPEEATPSEGAAPPRSKSTGRAKQPGVERRQEATPGGSSASPALFTQAGDRVGIDKTTIRVCSHYRKYLGKVLDLDEADLDVYWRSLNDRGGIFGRKIEERLAEDGGGRLVAQAYEECRGSFVIRGGPGAEGITPMRRLIESDSHPSPYFHYMARSDPTVKYSFSFYPTHELYGRLSAQFVMSRFADAPIGIIHKDSDNWDAARQGFLAALREAGVRVVADVPLSPDDRIVADELAAVHRAGAEVVWAWVELLDAIQLIKQSNAQRYPMRWVAPAANNFLIEALGDDALRPAPVTALALNPPITPGHPGAIPAAAAEYRRFEETYRRYRGKAPQRKSADLLFLKWLDDRQLAQLLDRCGPDCTRNRLVAPLLAGSLSASDPDCPFDFGRGPAAGYGASAFEVIPDGSGPIWSETAHCVDRF